jgi:hypothetical protein
MCDENNFGAAQPQGAAPADQANGHEARTDRQAGACPFCHSADVELLSLFGSQLSTDQWYCRACHTPFERFKRDDE